MTEALQKRIGYTFRDSGLLTLALTHPSVLNQKNYQRLEFLGDSVLGAVVARILYDLYPEEKEGDLARRLAALIRGETLASVARSLSLGEVLHIGASEKQAGGHENDSNLEDALEALIGAMYLDGGFTAVEAFIVPRWTELARQVQTPPKDAKTTLQEWAQARSLPIPSYRLVSTTGPAHAPEFTVEVTVQGYPASSAQAASKRMAEQVAAGLLLEHLKGVP
jgi:ribonuclease III